LIDGDPVKNLTALEHISYVFKAGVGYDPARIFEAFKGKVGLF
jgi:hypothetical protein